VRFLPVRNQDNDRGTIVGRIAGKGFCTEMDFTDGSTVRLILQILHQQVVQFKVYSKGNEAYFIRARYGNGV
jgi:hypothetical protein